MRNEAGVPESVNTARSGKGRSVSWNVQVMPVAVSSLASVAAVVPAPARKKRPPPSRSPPQTSNTAPAMINI